MRVANVDTGEDEWITIAYVPVVPTEKGPGGAERSRRRRMGVLQRVLFLALRDLIGASHAGVSFAAANGRKLLAFPRVLLYQCDQPEERAVLCLKPGQCAYPCSTCTVPLASLCSVDALNARSRTIINTLHEQLKAAGHLQHDRERQARLHIERASSVNSYAPALAAFAGLTTAPFLMYKIIGFDTLHVRFPLPLGLRLCAPFYCSPGDSAYLPQSANVRALAPRFSPCPMDCLSAGSGPWHHPAAGAQIGAAVPIHVCRPPAHLWDFHCLVRGGQQAARLPGPALQGVARWSEVRSSVTTA